MSAKKFGGAHSPGGDPTGPTQKPMNKFRGRPARSVDSRSILLFILPTPLLFGAFGALTGGEPIRLIMLLAAYAVLFLGAWLLREGQRAEAAYNERTIARPPAFPRKLCAAGLAGIGVTLATWIGETPAGFFAIGETLIKAVTFGAVATGAHLLAFGLDPMKSKGGSTSIHQAELDRVTEALDKAESKLRNMETLARQLRDREINNRVQALNTTVRDMIKMVEEDPRDLSRAKRYLNVYLKGAEEATRKYVENHQRLNDPKIREDYVALLTDLDASFSRGRETLLLDDRTDLEVEIEVLRDRLGQERA